MQEPDCVAGAEKPGGSWGGRGVTGDSLGRGGLGTDPVGRTRNFIHICNITCFELSDERAREHVKRQKLGGHWLSPLPWFEICKSRTSVSHSQASVLGPIPSPRSPASP